MITIFGLIIFATPFIFLKFFKDKTVGFLTIFTLSFLAHLIVALGTQILSVFNYSIIISIYALIDAVLIFIYFFKQKNLKLKTVKTASSSKLKINTEILTKERYEYSLVAVAFVVIFLNLFFVHYNFSGTVNTYNRGEVVVQNANYPYPYFSDEWVAVSFVNYTINSHSLPNVKPLVQKPNPITGEGYFKNPLVPYFSFLGDVFLFFGLNPLKDFALAILIVGITICTLFFQLLLSLGIDKRVSVFTLLIVPYITNGGNLPGIWFLIPMIVSLIFYLISLIGFAKENNKLIFLSSLMCLCLYPPFIAFVLPTLLVAIFKNKENKENKKWDWKSFWKGRWKDLWKKAVFILGSIIIAFVLVGAIVFSSFSPLYIYEILKMYLFRSNLVDGILSFPIWKVLPFFVLPFALLGFWPAFKKKLYFIIFPLLVGLLYWINYIDTENVFIIDFPRVVVVTSFLILVSFAIELDYLFSRESYTKVLSVITVVFVFVAIFNVINYTKNESWRGLGLRLNRNSDGTISNVMSRPAPTASEFLTVDDLRLFSGIKSKIFISPPWKGLVIAAATGNFPLATKPSTIDVSTMNYYAFMNLDCKEKQKKATENNIDYVYSINLGCPNFIVMSTSSEGLILYKYEK